MLPVVVVLVLVWSLGAVPAHHGADGTGVQQAQRARRAVDRHLDGTEKAPVDRTSLLQTWTGSWLPLAFTRLSLLKPLGPEAAWATGADMPTRAAVATASAKARFLRDMLVFPQKEFTDPARGGRVPVRVQAMT